MATKAPVKIGVPDEVSARGIAKSLDDLTLDGHRYSARVNRELTEGKLARTKSGASTVEVSVEDPELVLLNSPLLEVNPKTLMPVNPHQVVLDELHFDFVGTKMAGLTQPLGVVYEDHTVHMLRQLKGPVKAFRDKVTRAEFIDSLRAAIEKKYGIEIPFVCPELKRKQPIKTPKSALKAQKETASNRGGGFAKGVHLEVKGGKATAAQIALGEEALRIGESYNATEKVLIALIAALIDENSMGGPNVLQAEPFIAEGASTPATKEIIGFLTGKGWTGKGAIPFDNQEPNATPGEIAAHVQGNEAGASVYEEWVGEARKWVEAFTGGSAGSVTRQERYPFEVKPRETYWDAMVRLAGEVQWALFVCDGVLYFLDELQLVASKPVLTIFPGRAGIEDISFEYDTGKKINNVKIQARSSSWVAPPGSVVLVEGLGPANGRYLLESITAPLRKGKAGCQVELQRALKPLPEEAPSTKTVTFSSSAAGNAKAEKMLKAAEEISKKKLPYIWGGFDPNKGFDCSGFVTYLLNVGGFMHGRGDTLTLAGFGEKGKGSIVTIYDHAHTGDPTTEHTAIEIGGKVFESGGGSENSNPAGGPGEVTSNIAGFLAQFEIQRHPKGL